MKIIPLSYTTPNWMSLDSFIERSVGQSAIRFLDENKMTPGGLYSYIIALELLLGNKITRLDQANLSLPHITLSFGIECDEVDIILFMDIPGFKITNPNKIDRQDIYFLFVTATLKEWKDIIILNCRQQSDKYLKEIFNDFYELMKKANLGELFDDYQPCLTKDGTFYLERG